MRDLSITRNTDHPPRRNERIRNDLADLLAYGDSNWDYYLSKRGSSVYAVAREDSGGAGDSGFGDVGYWRMDVLRRPDSYQLTERGRALVEEKKP